MVAFTLVVSAVSGFIFGLRPAIRASRLDLVESLKQGGRSLAGRVDSHRFRAVLAIGEIALAMVLLTAAGLLIRSFQRIEEVPLGFDPQHVSVAEIQLPNSKYPKEEQQADFYKQLLAELRNTPGIESVSATRSLLLPRLPNSAAFTIEGRPSAIATPLTTDIVTPEFFSTLKIPLLKGRFFNLLDHANSLPVAIVNAATAERYWAREDPIGKRFVYGKAGLQTRWLTIIGVVADTKRAGLDQPVFTESYVPAAQNPDADMQIVIRTRLGVPAARSALQGVLHRLDPEQAVGKLMSLETALGERTASRRFTTFLLSLFAGTALAIAGVGVYGMISSMVAQRRQELGVRMALGALPGDVLRLVIGNVLVMAASGVVLGLIAALSLSQGLESLLFGIGRFDPGSYALASFGLLCVCLAAAISPAIRALSVDPVTTLRME
jgi:putative ABC transport system permease protein